MRTAIVGIGYFLPHTLFSGMLEQQDKQSDFSADGRFSDQQQRAQPENVLAGAAHLTAQQAIPECDATSRTGCSCFGSRLPNRSDPTVVLDLAYVHNGPAGFESTLLFFSAQNGRGGFNQNCPNVSGDGTGSAVRSAISS